MSFKDVIGQGKAVMILSGMLSNKRIASSYLFTGPSGIGKKFASFQFIKSINCLDAHSGSIVDSCDMCISCRKMESLTHPDLRVIVPEDGMIKIDKIRELDEFLSLTPMEGERKVVIVDDADKMNPNAGNAFLKTLEEPPADSTIILISAKEEALLDTIKSRCIKINFVPLTLKSSKTIMNIKGITFSDAQIDASMGSIGRLLAEDLLSKREKTISQLIHMLNSDKVEQWKDRDEMKNWFDVALTLLRDMCLIKIDDVSHFLINRDKKVEISDICKSADLKSIIECYERFLSLNSKLTFNLNKGIVLNYVQSILKDTFKSV